MRTGSQMISTLHQGFALLTTTLVNTWLTGRIFYGFGIDSVLTCLCASVNIRGWNYWQTYFSSGLLLPLFLLYSEQKTLVTHTETLSNLLACVCSSLNTSSSRMMIPSFMRCYYDMCMSLVQLFPTHMFYFCIFFIFGDLFSKLFKLFLDSR